MYNYIYKLKIKRILNFVYMVNATLRCHMFFFFLTQIPVPDMGCLPPYSLLTGSSLNNTGYCYSSWLSSRTRW